MKAGRIHALVAGFTATPDLLEKLDVHVSAALRAEVQAAGLDQERLRYFSGFITKVRHNTLRRTLGHTFKALAVTGLEIEMFAAYAPSFCSWRAAGPITEMERQRRWVSFLDDWLDENVPAHIMIRDVMAHELALQALRAARHGPAARRGHHEERHLGGSAPALRNALEILDTHCDPRKVIAVLDSAAAVKFIGAQRHFGYSFNVRQQRVNILEIDAFSAALLRLVDGHRTVAEMAAIFRTAGLDSVTPEVLTTALMGELKPLVITPSDTRRTHP